MTDKINGRTPEEIKWGLEHCAAEGSSCKDCVFCADCDMDIYAIERYALAYIQQLERERDAAVEQLKEVDKEDLFRCSHCIHDELCNDGLTPCVDCDKECPCHTCRNSSNWEWRGVQEVE